MGFLKVAIAAIVIGVMELITEFKDKEDRRCFEIAMSILLAGWIVCNGW